MDDTLIGLGLVLLAVAATSLMSLLKSRVNKLAADYSDKRPHGALALCVLQRDTRYLREVGNGATVDEAFVTAFGVTRSEFYPIFEQIRGELYQ